MSISTDDRYPILTGLISEVNELKHEVEELHDKVVSSGGESSGGSVDLTPYQQKTDDTLTTTDKTVVGAINENKSSLDNIATQVNNHINNHPNGEGSNITVVNNNSEISPLPYMLTNAPNTLTIPTYEGSGQAMHPKVLYFKEGWNGYKFWMAFTPYPNSDDFHENPSIVASHDGIAWVVPNGLTNPLDSTTDKTVMYNSDAHLVYNDNLDILECWYRAVYNNPKQEIIYRRTSMNGIAWTEREILSDTGTTTQTLYNRVCPIAWYENGKYRIWTNFDYGGNNRGMKYFESINGDNWVFKRDIMPNIPNNTHYISHCDIIQSHGKYMWIAQGINRSNGDLECYFYMESTDNVTYSTPTVILNRGASGQWDDWRIYRPAFVEVDGDIWLYYSCTKSNGTWGTGLIKIPCLIRNNLAEIQKLKTENILLTNQVSEIFERLVALEGGSVITYGQLIVSSETINATEGNVKTFTVKLDAPPSANQTVRIASDNADISINPSILTFTPSIYNTEQTVTLTIGQDEDTLNEVATITVSSASQVTSKTITVNITDDDASESGMITNGLIRYYNFRDGAGTDNNVIYDISSSGINGTLTGFTHDGSTNGWINGGLKFGGTQKASTDNINYKGDFTLECRFTAITHTKKVWDWNGCGINVSSRNTGSIYVSGTFDDSTAFIDVPYSTVEEEKYLTVTYNATTKLLKVYKNGALTSSKTTTNILSTGYQINIMDTNTGIFKFITVYNKVLSDSEIATNYSVNGK